MKQYVLLFSGGLDSTVAGRLAESRGHRVHPFFVRYGQRHAEREREAVFRLARAFGWWERTRIVTLELGGSSLTGGDAPLQGEPVVVPDRNLILLGHASNHARQIGADALLIGANRADHAGFPDCRPEFYRGLAGLLSTPVETPLLEYDKRQIGQLARRLSVPLEWTWSCYAGRPEPCGACGACLARAEATPPPEDPGARYRSH